MIKSGAFLILGLTLMASCSVSGQSRFQIGFKAGINFSSLTGTDPEMNESFASLQSQPFVGNFFSYDYDTDFFDDGAARFSATANVAYKLTDKIRIKLDIGYAGRGMNLKEDGQVSGQGGGNPETLLYGMFSYERKIKLNYLTVPLNFNYHMGSKNQFFIMAGMYADFLLGSKVSGEQRYITQMIVVNDGLPQTILTSGQSKFNDKDPHTSKFDYGISYGGGVELPLNPHVNFVFAITANHGLNQIDGKYDNDTASVATPSGYVISHYNYYGLNSNARNFTLSATMGIVYQL